MHSGKNKSTASRSTSVRPASHAEKGSIQHEHGGLLLQDFSLKCKVCAVEDGEEDWLSPWPLYVCFDCGFVGCWGPGEAMHFQAHASKSGHSIFVEMESGTVFCLSCNMFIWNSSLQIRQEAREVNAEETEAHCVSMRGLINMGNTCFMGSALQVLLHCDALVDFFLSSAHTPSECGKKRTGALPVCLACEFDMLFNQNYSGAMQPFAPHQFLHALWRSSKHLSGYEQQDAHEFLISTLNQLHTDLGGTHFACKCPVHTAFTGVLQSDVTCLNCGTVNASFDPFLDISLDIASSGFVLDPNTASLTLRECFQLFTHAEKLSSNTYLCSTCNHSCQEATKQLSIRAAPAILTIHLKRFEHSFSTVKIDAFVQFPPELSLFDYTTEGVHLSNELSRISAATGVGAAVFGAEGAALSASVIDPQYNYKKYAESMLYRLVATINHTGGVDSGHYMSYVAHPEDRGVWFKFDDALVSRVSASAVLGSNPYMLFYERIGSAPGDVNVLE